MAPLVAEMTPFGYTLRQGLYLYYIMTEKVSDLDKVIFKIHVAT